MAPICKDCVSGAVHVGTPTGRETKIHGLKTYVAEPPSGPPKGIIVIVPDGFGWTFINNRILADHFARKGNFLVYLPDFMKGKAMDPMMLDLVDQFYKPGLWANIMKIFYFVQCLYHGLPFLWNIRSSVTDPILTTFFTNLRADPSTDYLSIGAAGFCWGGNKTIKLCHDVKKTGDGKSLIDVGFVAHPSAIKVPSDITPIKKPLSVAHGTKDFMLPKAKAETMRTILEKKSELEIEWVDYNGAKHGFAIRGDPNSEKEQKQCLEAEDQAVAWFSRML